MCCVRYGCLEIVELNFWERFFLNIVRFCSDGIRARFGLPNFSFMYPNEYSTAIKQKIE